MERGRIHDTQFAGGIDLQRTLESGQTFLWQREDGAMFDDGPHDGWYVTALPATMTPTGAPEVIRVRQRNDGLDWESTTDATPILTTMLRLTDDLAGIEAAVPDDDILTTAFSRYSGMRVVRDPPVACLISFICSSQMRIPRIHEMQMTLAEEYGTHVIFDEHEYYTYPSAEALANAGEEALREHKLGYRASYVAQTAQMIAAGEAHPCDAQGLSYEEAREAVQTFVGVGDKVADCVLLFSLGYLEAVPLDTWIRGAIEEHYPDCARDSYAETSRAIRNRLGGEYAGYAQNYLFNYLRNSEE